MGGFGEVERKRDFVIGFRNSENMDSWLFMGV